MDRGLLCKWCLLVIRKELVVENWVLRCQGGVFWGESEDYRVLGTGELELEGLEG